MAKFPEPPAALTLPPALVVLTMGTTLWRIYSTGGAFPTAWNTFRYFGPVRSSRFDHHTAQPPAIGAHGILYAASGASAVDTCLAEFFQATRIINRTQNAPWLAGFALTRDVTLLDLTGTWPTQAGASMAITSGPRPRAQRWSRAIYAAYPHVEGVLYGSSMNANQPAYALYERALTALPAAPSVNRALADPTLLAGIAVAAGQFNYLVV